MKKTSNFFYSKKIKKTFLFRFLHRFVGRVELTVNSLGLIKTKLDELNGQEPHIKKEQLERPSGAEFD